MAASSLYGVNSVLSIGRVQTPTLKLVVDRDEAIENFNPQDYFLLRGQFSNAQTQADSPNATQMFWATWQPSNQVAKRFFDENGHCLDRKLIESIAAKLEDEPAQVISCEEIKKTQKSPLCFSLSALQKQASSQWGYSAKRVLELAQRLYETHKAITYPRTDCGYLPIEQFDEAPQLLSTLANIDPAIKALVDVCEPQVKSSVWNDQKVTAHHAMIPTLNDKVMLDKMTPEERHIYDLIRDQYLAQFLGDYEYQQRRIELLCAGETFTVTGNTPLKLGWKQILETNSREETNTENPPENLEALPKFVKGQRVINQAITIECKQTKPKPRFSDGTLIEAMKNVGSSVQEKTLKDILKNSHGMGTEATRANIIETLCKRGYLIRQKKHLLSTQKGRALIALVPDKLKNPRLTAQWEQKLHQIAQGNGDVDAFLQAQAHELTGMLEELQSKSTIQKAATLQLQSETQNNKVYLCPKCQAPLRRLKNKKGRYFWGCTQYPKCDFTTWEKKGKPSL